MELKDYYNQVCCYHHTDMDGKSAGWIVHDHFPDAKPDRFFPTNYNDKFNKHHQDEDVFIVDISISEATYGDFVNMIKTARSVTWIDHHQTSLDVIKAHQEEIDSFDNLRYFVSNNASGAMLTYIYFDIVNALIFTMPRCIDTLVPSPYNYRCVCDHQHYFDQSLEIPYWILLVDDYDRWQCKFESSNPFMVGFESHYNGIIDYSIPDDPEFNNIFWSEMNNNEYVNSLISEGLSILRYLQNGYERDAEDLFEWDYEGTTFLCKNGHGNSWNFDIKDGLIEKYPAAILFHYSGKIGKWLYSVYSADTSDFNCSEFCEKFGGGGHFHASGFSTNECIPFIKGTIRPLSNY